MRQFPEGVADDPIAQPWCAFATASPGLPRITFRFRDTAYQRLRSTLLGKTILFTDRSDWSDEQIVLAYRAQHHLAHPRVA